MSETPQPGFYDDPEDASQQRWWDGERWTDVRQLKSPTHPPFPPPQHRGPQDPKPWYEKPSTWIAVGGVVAVLVLGSIAAALGGSGGEDSSTGAAERVETTQPDPEGDGATAEAQGDPDEVTESASEAPADIDVSDEPEPEPDTESPTGMTRSQESALASAREYLSFTSFSRTGLIDQLEFEQFSTEDATFAVDALDVDWEQQAAQSADEYLSFSAFSRSGLIDQLEFDGFTADQAASGVAAVAPDWNEQAALAAEEYLAFSSFSPGALIDQLVFDGFTTDQAEYGVDQAGL